MPVFKVTKTNVLKLTFVLAVVVASVLFLKQGVHSGIHFPHADKLGHFIIFFSLALLLDLSFNLGTYKSLIALSFYGALIEALQGLLPYRTASVGDIVADIFGVIVYLFVLRTSVRKSISRIMM